jgi:hypothetical protein
MWYEKSVREELIERILDKLPRSVRKEQEVERYAHDYAYKLELGNVKSGDENLIKSGVEYVLDMENERKQEQITLKSRSY